MLFVLHSKACMGHPTEFALHCKHVEQPVLFYNCDTYRTPDIVCFALSGHVWTPLICFFAPLVIWNTRYFLLALW